MDKERGHMTQRVLDLTLEMVYLLTGENYIAFKLSSGVVATSMKKSPILGEGSRCVGKDKKIEEVTNEIIDLLMAEVACDVHQADGTTVEEPCGRFEEPRTEEERPSEMSTATQPDVKVEEDDAKHVMVKEEEPPPEINNDGRSTSNNVAKFSFIAEDGKTEDDEFVCDLNTFPPHLRPSSNLFTHEGDLPDLRPPTDHGIFHGVGDMLPSTVHVECYTQREDLGSPPSLQTEEKPYSCPQCGKGFTRRAYLAKHQRIHAGATPFSCAECGKCFTRRTSLINHQRTHTGVKPYSCPACGKRFTWRTTFVEHQRSHTGVKPYSCPACGKRFSLYSAFSKHRKIHTGEKPYSCAECGRHFTRSDHLLIHRRTHTGEKPYSCDECGKRFNERARLVSHQVVHTGIHPYSCSVCGRGFITNSRLVKHQQVHLSGSHTRGLHKE